MGDYEYRNNATVSANQHDTKAFWMQQFANLDAEQFPLLPSASYTPRPSQSVEHNIEGLGWDSSAFKPSVFIRLAWAILQSRYTNCNDVLFGAAAGVNGTAFPNRIQLVRDETVCNILRSLQSQGEQMAAHSRIDCTELIQDASKEADAACDFKTLLVLTSAEARPAQQRERRRKSLVDLYALTMECTVSLSGLGVRFVHDPAILSNEQVERMSLQLGHVLRQILMQPQSQIGEISIASDEDLQDIQSWNRNVAQAVDTTLTRLLAKAPAAYSDALAVDAWDGKLTYSRLDELSTRLAFYLAAQGVGADSIVPLCFEKSMWTSVALIAVIKTACASMCLNANHPAEYLRGIVKRSRPSALLCSTTTKALATQLTDQPIVTINDEFFRNLNIQPVEPLPAVQPSSRLCVIPTSGSSLAVLTHGNFATALLHQTRLFDVKESSRIYDLDSYSSDLVWLNHLLAFTNGACLCVPSDQERKGDLAESLSRHQASVLVTTAASAENIDLSQAIDLETLVVSGEVTPKLELPPHVRLISAYGVAECTILATYASEQQVMRNDHCLGRGSAGNTWVVSTETKELCAVGEIGELLLESPLVGAGYMDDKQKTADSFVQSTGHLAKQGPHAAGGQGPLFRTGDLVRYLPDGTLLFVGHRNPWIKKIRGLRIDLREIEHNMRQVLGSKVADVATEVISAHGQPVPVLAAFIVPAGNLSDASHLEKTVAELAETLMTRSKQMLPSHMLPVVFLPIRSLPRTNTGEVDRKKLRQNAERKSRDPEQRTASHAIRPKQAMTILEVQLQQLWAQVLQIKNRSTITANSNWIQLGGDDSSAMRLSNAAQNWGLDITAANVMARPRLADMAECVKHFHRASIVAPEGVDQPMRRGTFESSFASTSSYGGSTPLVAKNNASVDRRRSSILVNGKEELPSAPMAPRPVTALQRRALLGSVERTAIGTEYYAFDLQPTLDAGKAIDACRKLVQHFDILRTIFVQIEDKIYQTIMPEVEVPIEVQQITNDLESASKAVMEKDSHLSLPLGRSFLRIYILQKPAEHMRIILRTNQAYTDEQSISILAAALSDVLAGNRLVPATSFSETILQHQASNNSQSYWRNLLLGSSMSFIPKSPTAHSQGESKMVSATTTISPPITLASSTITGEALFLAACSNLLSSFSVRKEVLFGHTISTRPASSQNMIGPCKNIIPIRIRTSSSILRQVQEQLASASRDHNASVDFASVANDNCMVKDCDGAVEKGDFGVITEWSEGVVHEALGKREEVGRSCAILIRGRETQGGKVKVEICARSDVQSRKSLEGMLKVWGDAVVELVREGQGKRKASMAEGFY